MVLNASLLTFESAQSSRIYQVRVEQKEKSKNVLPMLSRKLIALQDSAKIQYSIGSRTLKINDSLVE